MAALVHRKVKYKKLKKMNETLKRVLSYISMVQKHQTPEPYALIQ